MAKIELSIQCKSCGGTGVYVGMAEHEGAAVVCTTCNGTGEQAYKFEYTPFAGRQVRGGVERVYVSGMGYCIAPKKLTFDNIGEIDMSREGVSYNEFWNGKMPGHVEKLGCPMLADQGACDKIDGFTSECTHGSLRHCSMQQDKAECWKRFHEQKED